MKKYGLLGGKLGHSLSPAIHRSFFKHMGIEGSYEAAGDRAGAFA